MPYYNDAITRLDDIRSTIKHVDPGQINLSNIRDSLGSIRQDLEILAFLKRPNSYNLEQQDDGTTKITITMILDRDEADEVVKKLWIELP
jgi:hypothetical protein